MITEIEGDATRPVGSGDKIIAHCCNTMGYWGKGFVRALSQRWTFPETEYRKWFTGQLGPPPQLGDVQFVRVEPDIWVANIIGQNGILGKRNTHPISYSALNIGLCTVAQYARSDNMTVHMPRIGSGLAGGDWPTIRQYIETAFAGLDVTIYTLPDTII